MNDALQRWFGAEQDWERPRPTPEELRGDLRWALVALLVVALGHELARSMGMLSEERLGAGWQYLGILSAVAMVAVRRRFPVAVTLGAGVHMIVLSVIMTMTMSQLPLQMVYFLLLFSGVAWARNRRALMVAVGVVLVLLVLLFAWSYALGSGIEQIRENIGSSAEDPGGLLPPVVAVVLFSVLANAIYFGFAIGLGQVAWNGALRQEQVHEQASTIAAQTARLTDQAVVAERLRIARELHDVVAHHISVMGVQATAARRVMDRDPQSAKEALGAIEHASRDAVGQMRELLGTLRTTSADVSGQGPGEEAGQASAADRAPQPTLASLPALVAQASTPLCTVTLDVVESSPGASARVAPPVQLTAYRIVQEALANVRKHSTARQARATVRIDEATGRVEVEVLDDGSPRVGTSGSGLGLLGMRERADHLGGGIEVGRRQAGSGWRVRVWLPLDGHRPAPATVTSTASV